MRRTLAYLAFAAAAGWPVALYWVIPERDLVPLAGLCLVNGFAVALWAQTRKF